MTEKLYYEDSHIFEFTARVEACREVKGGYEIRLDRTAFFPGGGGQEPDSGMIGEARVVRAREEGDEILHLCDRAIAPGTQVQCALDREQRLRRMQNHSGEHIVSGIAHRLYGCENVGFHMGETCMTIDFDRELGEEELRRVETLANEAVRDDLEIVCTFPDEQTLKTMEYRSKLELTENVRIVSIEGVDRCACCAPHVGRTGEVGVVKILDWERHRGGVRLSLVCGMDALEDYREKQQSVAAISKALSAKRAEVALAVERVLAEEQRLKERADALSMELVRLRAESTEATEGNLCVFDRVLDEIAQRELVNLLMQKCGGAAAVFCTDGGEGYRYIIGSRSADLRRAAKDINARIDGRGGGRPEMIQGRAFADEESIRKNILELCLDKIERNV